MRFSSLAELYSKINRTPSSNRKRELLADSLKGLSPKEVEVVSYPTLGSVHSQFGSSKNEMTKRITSALSNEHLDILGHPSGRMIGRRKGYDEDFEKIFKGRRG